ncbi:DoxX family protein [uncultured Aquimarina sp.]|uniref:DoxX family protein n=1 Tax=uncultured Aquimarina sp. TaxID=575652 RepID=UPI0026376382|nr:DoxX family protein [uncultured Aquimarina sp.]
MKIIYWISTVLVSLMLLWSSYTYFFSKETIEGIKSLGFPNFFRIQLGVLKIIAVFVLLIPQISVQVKEWGYAGVGLFFVTAIVAHIAHKDSIFISLINVFFIGLLIISNIYMYKLKIV